GGWADDLAIAICEVANGGKLLACGDFHKLGRFARKLDVARIDDEEFQTMVANASANLPSDEGILVRRIVADEENGFRFIELLHGEQGIFCVFAKRREEAGVVGGSVMIDVVGAERDASEALEKVVFFVRSAVRTDEADRICAMRVANRFKFSGCGLRGFFPGDGQKLIAFANEGLLDALGMLGEVEPEASLDAKEISVDAAHVAVVGANNFVIANAERGFAAVRTVRADSGDVLHFP